MREHFCAHLIEERMAGHIKDVHFDFSVPNLHPENTRSKIKLPARLSFRPHLDKSQSKKTNKIHSSSLREKKKREKGNLIERNTVTVNLLGDTIIDSNSGKVLRNEPFLTVTLDDAALIQNKNTQLSCLINYALKPIN